MYIAWKYYKQCTRYKQIKSKSSRASATLSPLDFQQWPPPGQLLGTVAEMAPEPPAAQMGVPESRLHCHLQLPANVHPQRQQVPAQMAGILSPMWET